MTGGQHFSAQQFLINVGERLVMEFGHAAQGTTPTLAGDSREHPARKQLERLLPPAAAVGSGVVIDCSGNVSKQQDIVIYDQAVTPVFSVNDNPSATYYPIEGVIAVGEVKTAVGATELADAFQKVRSVQDLKRCVGPSPNVFRPYGSPSALHGTTAESFDQQGKATDQVFGFLLCQKLSTQIDTTIANAKRLWAEPGSQGLGAIAALEQGIIQPLFNHGRIVSIREADSIYFDADSNAAFARLLEVIMWMVRQGRTVRTEAFGHYLAGAEGPAAHGSRVVPLEGAPNPEDGT